MLHLRHFCVIVSALTTTSNTMTAPISLSPAYIALLNMSPMSIDRIAYRLIACGLYEDRPALHRNASDGSIMRMTVEYDRAVFTDWALGLYDTHGDNWLVVLTDEVAKLELASADTVAMSAEEKAAARLRSAGPDKS